MITMGGFSLPIRTIREMLVSSIDVIIQTARLRDGSRRITQITEIMGLKGDVITTQDLMVYEISGEDASGRIKGKHRSTGVGRPRFWERARYFGEEERLARALDASEVQRNMKSSVPASWSNTWTSCLDRLGGLRGRRPAFVFVYPLLSGERKAEKRQAAFVGASTRRAIDKQADAAARRKQITEHLKEIETRNSRKRVTLEGRLTRAGLKWSRRRFLILATISGTGFGALLFFVEGNLYVAFAAALVGAAGLPLWALKFLGQAALEKICHDCSPMRSTSSSAA